LRLLRSDFYACLPVHFIGFAAGGFVVGMLWVFVGRGSFFCRRRWRRFLPLFTRFTGIVFDI
jgi:hypothetical protein